MSRPFVQGLGVLARGPCVLGSGPGIGIGLRCVFAHSEGLLLSVQVKAIGQAATDAHDSDIHPRSGRSGRGGHRPPPAPRLPLSEVQLRVPALEAGWPEVRVPMTTTVLDLSDLDGLPDQVVRLR